jgi:uncharacterized protein YdeI (BOF family)
MPAPRRVSALLVSFMVVSASLAAAIPPGLAAAVAAWPASSGLVLAEVMTGGASASDEYVEIANAGSAAADLGGLEIVYVTASGATTTRKAAFASPLSLAPRSHLLVANATGIYASMADATYSGGLAADGGAIALRRSDGTVVDAVGWGTAANAYVEGSPAPAPPARSSIERLPGEAAGNTQDTNDNRSDWFVQPNPIPQPLGSAPPPSPTSAPTDDVRPTADPNPSASEPPSAPTAMDTPTPLPTETPSSDPTSVASAVPSAEWTATDTATPQPSPSPTASATTSPTPASSAAPPSPSPSPSASAAQPATDLETVAEARAQLPGTRVHVGGVVTIGPGLVGVDDLLAMQDSSGGIFVRLPAPCCELPIGRSIEVEGTLAAPYGQLEIRELDWLAAGADDKEPAAIRVDLQDVGERTEGSLVTIRGTVDSIQTDAGRLTITIGDGLDSVRALADPPAGISRSDVARGDVVLATGIVGQHATATGRLDGYRLWLRRPTDITVRAPIPTDPPDPTVRPAVIRSLGSSAAGSGNAGESPETTPGRVAIASLAEYLDREVTVAGLVTATAGGSVRIDDGTGEVRVGGPSAAEALSTVEPGDAIEVTGIVRQDAEGLVVEADPASIIDEPAGRGETQGAEPGTAASSGDAPTRTPASPLSPAAAASVRIASSPAAPPDGAALVAVLLAVLATVAGAVVLARRPGGIHRRALAERVRRPLLGPGRSR